MRVLLALALALVLSLALPSQALAHGDEESQSLPDGQGQSLPDYTIPVLEASTAVIAFGLLASLALSKSKATKKKMVLYKKALFIVVLIPIVLGTAFLSINTIVLNLSSPTGGPVHWHADFEVWACGQKIELESSIQRQARMGGGILPENKAGTPVFHHHDDNRIHIEGTPASLEDITLGEFFHAIDGELTENELSIWTGDGMREWFNGDPCNGQPASLRAFVNGKPLEDFADYVIAPYSTVPPGDFIIISFSPSAELPAGAGGPRW